MTAPEPHDDVSVSAQDTREDDAPLSTDDEEQRDDLTVDPGSS